MKNWDVVPFMPDPSDPAPGTEFAYSIAADRVGLLLGASFKLVTAAGAPSRTVHLELGGKHFSPHSAVNRFTGQPGSQTAEYVVRAGAPQSVVAGAYQCATLPKHFEIFPGELYPIRTSTFFINALDQWSVSWLYKERPL